MVNIVTVTKYIFHPLLLFVLWASLSLNAWLILWWLDYRERNSTKKRTALESLLKKASARIIKLEKEKLKATDLDLQPVYCTADSLDAGD